MESNVRSDTVPQSMARSERDQRQESETSASEPQTASSERGEPVRKKIRRCANACDRCKLRKQRCDGENPCFTCTNAQAACVFSESKKKNDEISQGYMMRLEDRCAQLETALRKADPSSADALDHYQPGAQKRPRQARSPETIETQLPSKESSEGSPSSLLRSNTTPIPIDNSSRSGTGSSQYFSQLMDSMDTSQPNSAASQGFRHPSAQASGPQSYGRSDPLAQFAANGQGNQQSSSADWGSTYQPQFPAPGFQSMETFSQPYNDRSNVDMFPQPQNRPPNNSMQSFSGQSYPEQMSQDLNQSGSFGLPYAPQQTGSQQTTPQAESDESHDVEQHVSSLSLKALAEQPYLGPSSQLSFAKMVKTSMRKGKILSPTPFQPMVPRSLRGLVDKVNHTPSAIPRVPTAEIADGLYRATFMHVQARYPFMEWPKFLSWHRRRDALCVSDPKLLTDPDDRTGAYFVWLVYAVGAGHVWSATRGKLDNTLSERYFEASQHYLDDVLARHDLLTVQALALIAMFSFRADNGPAVWHLVGFAMRICIEHGMHRALPDTQREKDPLQAEVRSRVFWALYTLDRLAAITLGRPMSIADSDIDAELPLDVDCFCVDPKVLLSLHQARAAGHISRNMPTSMTSAIHWIRMYRLRSLIAFKVYTVDKRRLSNSEVETLLAQLDEWKDALPVNAQSKAQENMPMISYDRFLRTYNLSRLLVLRPRLSPETRPGDADLRRVAEAAAASCELGKRLLGVTHAHSLASLYQDFLSGVTVLHCLAIDKNVISTQRSSRAIRACLSVLVIYSTLFVEAESFRDLFEALVDDMDEDEGSNPSIDPSQWQQRIMGIGGLFKGNQREDFVALATNLGLANEITTLTSTRDAAPSQNDQIAAGPMIFPQLSMDTSVKYGDPSMNMDLSSIFDLAGNTGGGPWWDEGM